MCTKPLEFNGRATMWGPKIGREFEREDPTNRDEPILCIKPLNETFVSCLLFFVLFPWLYRYRACLKSNYAFDNLFDV